jgi:hypothetical protein
MASTSDSEVTSQRTASARDPPATSSAAVCSAASWFTSPMTMAAPSRANVSTIARPIPCAAPVTTAVLPSNKPMNNTLVIGRGSGSAPRSDTAHTAASPRSCAISSEEYPSSASIESVCWPNAGTGPAAAASPPTPAAPAGRGAGRRVSRPRASGARVSWAWADDVLHRVVARVADPGGVGHRLDLGQRVLARPLADGLVDDLAFGRSACHVGGESRVGGQVRPFEHLEGQALPLAIVGRAEHDRLPVAGG